MVAVVAQVVVENARMPLVVLHYQAHKLAQTVLIHAVLDVVAHVKMKLLSLVYRVEPLAKVVHRLHIMLQLNLLERREFNYG